MVAATSSSSSLLARMNPNGRVKAKRGSPSNPPITATYQGPYNAVGQKHGEGEMTWSNGDVYTGMFVNDVRQGNGTLKFGGDVDGGEYVGEWSNNVMHGAGTRRYPNGDLYVGNYDYGKRHGEGRFYYGNGDLYNGAWKDNAMTGTGRYYYANGQSFEGTFQTNKRHGKGKTQLRDGSIEVFQYINDQRVGQGVRWNPDRTKAWRMWLPSNTVRTGNVGPQYEKQSISIAEAVSLVYEIENAVQSLQDEESFIC